LARRFGCWQLSAPAVCETSVADLASQCAAMTSLRAAELIARTSDRVRLAQRHMEAMMQIDATSWEVHSLIASDRVEGTPVRSAEGTMIGTIERVIIDKTSGNVSCAVLSFNGSVRMGRDHLAIPWHGLTYDRTTASYNL